MKTPVDIGHSIAPGTVKEGEPVDRERRANRASGRSHEPYPPSKLASLLNRWGALVYLALTTCAEMVFIELYCHWHGAQFLLPNPLNLYSAANIDKLCQISFVGLAKAGDAPSVMSFTAEILMWSSLGVWARRVSRMADRYHRRTPDFAYDVANYIGILGAHTSVAAAVLIILKLTNFKIFNVSLDDFEAVTGLSFLLGFFGDQTLRILAHLRKTVFGKVDRGEDTGNEEESPD